MAFSWVEYYTVESYTDLEGVVHSCSISKWDDGIIIPTEIKGSVTLNLGSIDDLNGVVRGVGITLNLEASSTNTLSDLYTKNENVWLVNYIRDGVSLFSGFLSNEGIYEDFVNDKWVMSIDCVDGLGNLENLSYVNSSGVPFSGNQKLIEIISNCLLRTGVSKLIYTNIDTYYTGLATTLDILDNVYYNADRFIKDDGETIMSCAEVLSDVLAPFNAVVTSNGAFWYIYKLNQLFNDDTPTFFTYYPNGTAYTSPTTLDFSADLGSQIDGYYPHHVNANQSIRNIKSIAAYRINYKYGVVKSLLTNIFLENVFGTIADWTINSYTNLTLNASNLGVDILTIVDGSEVKNMTSDVISLSLGDLISYTYKYKVIENDKAGAFIDPGIINYKIKLTDGVSTYYWNITDWATFDVMLTDNIGSLDSISTISNNLTALPIAGDVTFEIHTSTKDVTATSSSKIHVQEVSITAQQSGNAANINGEFHTVQREDAPSTKIKDIVTVNNGDNPSDIYYGTIYKTDGTTPTETWFRKGKTEELPLLQIMGEETLRLFASTSKEFSGDFYGYLPHYSIVSINGISALFVFKEYSYNSATNITSMKLTQIYGAELTDIDYELTYDYGNVVKPTIKG